MLQPRPRLQPQPPKGGWPTHPSPPRDTILRQAGAPFIARFFFLRDEWVNGLWRVQSSLTGLERNATVNPALRAGLLSFRPNGRDGFRNHSFGIEFLQDQ